MRRFAANPNAYLKNVPNFVYPVVKLGPCKVGRVVRGYRCTKCERDLESRDLKKSACRKCGTKAVRVEYCLQKKVLYRPACHPEKAGLVPVQCCGKTHRTPSRVENRALVSYTCGKCKATAGPGETVVHEEGCRVRKFGLKKVCSKSGSLPHAEPVR